MHAKTIVLFALFAALLSFTSGCGMLGTPTAKIVGVKMGDVSVKSATILFDVEINNPYTVALPLAGADYALSTEGQQFMSGEADIQSMIPAGESKVLTLPVQVHFLELFQTVKGVRGKSEIPYTAALGLSVKPPAINKLRLPLKKDGVLKLPSPEGVLNRASQLLQR